MIKVPFADIHAQYLSIKPEIDAAIAKVISTSSFIRGPDVTSFETAFAHTANQQHCVSCANGTDAIYIAMKALGTGPGDEVIVPAMSWISTSETVSQTGARVVFCDIDPETYTLDPNSLEGHITDKTAGIIPVHLYGHPAKMDAIMAVASRHGLWVIEDSAQAHLAQYNGQQIGTFGNAATFSFYPGKNLGAMGDAGALVTADPELAERSAKFARHGGLVKGQHEIEGINSRLDGLQAAILNVKLPHLTEWTARRRQIAQIYLDAFSDVPWLKLPQIGVGAEPVWHLFVVQCAKRDALAGHLNNLDIQTAINYPCALPFLPCYREHGHRHEEFPQAHLLAGNGLSLPIFPEMTDEQIDKLISAVKSFEV